MEEKRGANWDAEGAEVPLRRAGLVPKTKAGKVAGAVEGVVPPEVAAEEAEERELGDEAELVAAEEEDPCSAAMAEGGAGSEDLVADTKLEDNRLNYSLY